MHVLSKTEIRYITETVKNAGITFSHLQEDLIDHLCCEVEHEMENGLNFQQAIMKIKSDIGINDLRQVQMRTLFLIDKNYRIMKNLMKISGVISASLILIGSLFKLMHWPGATIILLTGFIIASVLFLPGALYVMQKENKTLKKPLLFVFAFLGAFGFTAGILFKIMHWPGTVYLITGGIGILCCLFLPMLLSNSLKQTQDKKLKRIYIQGVVTAIIFLMATHFKLMHWPGASILLLTGSLSFVLLFIIPYSFYQYKKEAHIQPAFIYLIAGTAWFLLFTMLLSLNIQKESLVQFRYMEELLDSKETFYDAKTNELLQTTSDSNLNALLYAIDEKTRELLSHIEKIKTSLIARYGEEDIQNLNTLNSEILRDTHFPKEIMFGQGEAQILKSRLDQYTQFLSEKTRPSLGYTSLMDTWLSMDVQVMGSDTKLPWEEYYFKNITMMGCIQLLTAIQTTIKKSEHEALNQIRLNSKKLAS